MRAERLKITVMNCDMPPRKIKIQMFMNHSQCKPQFHNIEVKMAMGRLTWFLKPELRRVGDHGDFQLKFLVFEHYASLK